jgi:hypothetical protein
MGALEQLFNVHTVTGALALASVHLHLWHMRREARAWQGVVKVLADGHSGDRGKHSALAKALHEVRVTT